MRQARKAQSKLGYDRGSLYEGLAKSKRMHWKSYELHRKTIEKANAFFSSEMMRRFNIRPA
ncbi:MAG: hypothetical protein D6703_01475 [Zetaproteobacteria bacterium]|nr:MAG: hypothetical protein D6703_01475 [Zetaproteobacteria bacterium]